MRSLFISFLLFYSCVSLQATHIIGGSISYRHLGNRTYEIRLEVLRDCLNGAPQAPFDDPAVIGIFFDQGFFGALSIPFSGSDTLSIIRESVCVTEGYVCVHKAVYQDTVTLPLGSIPYTIAYQRCCRSNILLNLVNPLFTGMTFHSVIDPHVINSSPVFNSDFPAMILVNTPFVYDGSATDVDGDSLVYELTMPFAGASGAEPMPQPPSPPPYEHAVFRPPYSTENMLGGQYPLTIDPVNGSMVAIPRTEGVFQIAYAVHEYREGKFIGTTYREFAFVVVKPIVIDTYTVSGTVYTADSIPLDKGQVQLLKRDLDQDSLFLYAEQPLGLNGTYSFPDLPAGVFYIKAIVDTASVYYNYCLPTYYQSEGVWFEAQPINQCDSAEYYRDIYLLCPNRAPGQYGIDGVVTYGEASGTPVPQLSLLLATAEGEYIQARTTNNAGYFKFEHLHSGIYFLHADLLNSSIDNRYPPAISLDGNTTVEVLLHEDSLTVEYIVGLNSGFHQPKPSLKLYPNPARQEILLEVNGMMDDEMKVVMIDLNGRIIRSEMIPSSTPMKWSIESLPAGLYGIRVFWERGYIDGRFVKK